MNSNLLRHFCGLLLISLAGASEASAELNLSLDCAVRSVSTPGLSARGRVIRFPDGREITLIGQNHGSRTGYQDIESFLDDSKSTSNKDFLDRLNYSVNPISDPDDEPGVVRSEAAVRESTREANQDAAFLRAYLGSKIHADSKYVGVEGSREAVETQTAIIKRFRSKLHAEFARRNIVNPALEASIVTSRFGAPFYLQETEPGLLKERKLLGYVSSSESEKVAAAVKRMEAARNTLATQKPALVSAVDKAFAPFDLALLHDEFSVEGYGSYVPEKDEVALRSTLLSEFKATDRTSAQAYLDSKFALLKAAKIRDRSDAQTLVDQPSSGVMFVGRAHLESVSSLLRAKCLEKLDRTLQTPGAKPGARPSGSAH